ncbi:MAG: hypothetical protein ABI832_00305 [bacterium]
MAAKWENHSGGYSKLQKAIKEYSAKACNSQLELFLKHYKACEALEEKLSFALVKARSNGVDKDTLSDFKKDKGFSDAYKTLDKEVDALWKEQVKLRQMGNEAKQTVNDLKVLVEHIEADLKLHQKELDDAQEALKKDQAKAKSGKGTLTPSVAKAAAELEKEFKKQEPALLKLLKEIAADSKDLTEAGGLYRKNVDQKMDNYAAKFEKMIEKTLDLAPKGTADESGLPTALQERVLVVAVKKAVALAKLIEKHCKAALEKAEKDRNLAGPELKAARTGLDQLKKSHKALAANRKKYAAAIKKAKDSKELYKQFKFADEAFAGAEKTLLATMKQIVAMK